MNDWAWTALWVGLGLSTAVAIGWGISAYRDPSVECVKAGGTWVVSAERSSADHCEKVKP